MAGLGPAEESRPLLVKIVMAGESCVGKTSIVRRYTEPGSPPAGSPATSYMATIGILLARSGSIHLVPAISGGAQGFVLVYDITNLKSFQSITIWINDIYEKAGDEVDVILLGNKCDMEAERVVPKQKGEKRGSRQTHVHTFNCFTTGPVGVFALSYTFGGLACHEVQQYAGLLGNTECPFFETSAKENVNIERAFSVLTKEILEKKSGVLHDLDVVSLNETKKRTCCAF